jgi:hypothetical protein
VEIRLDKHLERIATREFLGKTSNALLKLSKGVDAVKQSRWKRTQTWMTRRHRSGTPSIDRFPGPGEVRERERSS